MRQLLLCLLSLAVVSCASIRYSAVGVDIPGFETADPKHRSKSKIQGVDLGIDGAQGGIEELASVSIRRPDPFIEEAEPEESLEELLLLEIQANRGEDIPATVEGMINYATTYQNAEVAGRAHELSALVYNQNTALAAAAKWYELDPASAAAQSAYIRELLVASNYEIAFELMATRIEQNRDSDFRPIAHLYQLIDEPQARALIATYNRYISLYPERRSNLELGRSIMRYKLAHFLFYGQEFDKSLALLNLIIANSRDRELRQQATELKGRIYLMTRREAGNAFYAGALRSYPSSYHLHVHYALYLLQQGSRAEAEQLLIRFADQQPNEDKRVYRLVIMGLGAKQEGLNELYDYIYEKISALEDENHKLLLQGVLHMGGGFSANDAAMAEEKLSRVSISSDHAVAALPLRLKNAVRAQQFDAAEAILDETLGYDRQLYIYLTTRYTRELIHNNQAAQAKKVVRSMLKQLGQDRDALEAAAYGYYEMGENSAMIRNFEKALRLNRDDHSIKNSYGYVLADRDIQLDKAKDLIDEAVQANPASPAYVDSLGWWHYRSGQLQEARYLLEWAHRKKNDAEIAAHYGEVLWHLGFSSRAEYLWLTSHEIFPNSKVLLDTMARYQVNWSFLQEDAHFFNSELIE